MLDSSAFNLRELVEKVGVIARTSASNKGIDFICDIDPTVNSMMELDQGRLRQVLTNLVSNAIKFTKRGFVELTVSAQVKEGSQYEVLFFRKRHGDWYLQRAAGNTLQAICSGGYFNNETIWWNGTRAIDFAGDCPAYGFSDSTSQ